MSKYSALIKEARKPESQKAIEPEKPSPPEPDVNLCVKVPAARRRHWASESKRTGTSMTAVIIEALSEKFGEPKKDVF